MKLELANGACSVSSTEVLKIISNKRTFEISGVPGLWLVFGLWTDDCRDEPSLATGHAHLESQVETQNYEESVLVLIKL